VAICLAAGLRTAAAPAPVALVICAPGYPSNTKEAQPSMDALAASVAQAAGWPASRVTVSYYETDEGGTEALRAGHAAMALVPLPYFLVHAKDLKLVARAQTTEKGGSPADTWTLFAKKGRVTSPASLSGWQVVSLAGYAPGFIRSVALASWGELPKSVTFVPSGQVLSALRKAAAGDDVAVLLDATQTASLGTLPFASDLEPVAKSPAVPAVLLCSVGSSLPAPEIKTVGSGLLKMHESQDGAAALDAVRLARFTPLDTKSLSAAVAAYDAGRSTGSR